MTRKMSRTEWLGQLAAGERAGRADHAAGRSAASINARTSDPHRIGQHRGWLLAAAELEARTTGQQPGWAKDIPPAPEPPHDPIDESGAAGRLPLD